MGEEKTLIEKAEDLLKVNLEKFKVDEIACLLSKKIRLEKNYKYQLKDVESQIKSIEKLEKMPDYCEHEKGKMKSPGC